MSLSQPTLLQHWFAQLNPTLTNSIPDSPATTYNASWQTGFQLANKTPLASGGMAPEMEDVNGILAVLSQYAQWQSVGAGFIYSATLSAAVGGYPLGAVVRDGADPSISYMNTIANNTNGISIANVGPTGGWDFYTTGGAGTKFGLVMLLADQSTVANSLIIKHAMYYNYQGGVLEGSVIIWVQAITNTGACTAVVNGNTSHPVVRHDGSAVVAGDLVAGSTYAMVYDGVLNSYVLLSFLPSYLPATITRAFATGATASVAVTSTTGQMCGLAYQITPQSSGDVMVNLSYRLQNSGALNPSSATMELHYGTGTPPTNGAVPAGTLVGASMTDSIASGASVHRSATAVLSGLTKGTPYWFDLDIAIASANGTLVEVMLSAMEL